MDAYKADLIFKGFLPLGVERLPSGETQGILPKNPTILREIGHIKQSMLRVIRGKCLDCAYTPSEVRKCVSTTCPLWPYRMGTNPFRTRAKSEAPLS